MVISPYNDCSSCASVKDWIVCFKRAKFSIRDDKRRGRPITEVTSGNIVFTHDLILSVRQIGLKRITDTFKISYDNVHQTVRVDLGIKI